MNRMAIPLVLTALLLMPISSAVGIDSQRVPLFSDPNDVVTERDLTYTGTADFDGSQYTDVDGFIIFKEKANLSDEAKCIISGDALTEPITLYDVPCREDRFGVDADLSPGHYSVLLQANNNGKVFYRTFTVISEFEITFDARLDVQDDDEYRYLYSPIKVLPGIAMKDQTSPYGKLPSGVSHPVSVSGGIVTSYAFITWYEQSDPDDEDTRIDWNGDTVPTKDTLLYAHFTEDKRYTEQYSATFTLNA